MKKKAARNPVNSRPGKPLGHRLKRLRSQSLHKPMGGPDTLGSGPRADAALDCGWGRLIFAQTFDDPQKLIDTLTEEAPEQRNIAFYVREPHVLLATAPQQVFLDPSHAYRLNLSNYRASRRAPKGFLIRRLSSEDDAKAVNAIYASRGMVSVDPDFFWKNRDNRSLRYFVAEEENSGAIIGTVTGVDHAEAFGDPECGASLWCLAVDPQARHPGVGEMLIRRVAEHFQARGASYVDLSVLHDNDLAIGLYEKLGFQRVPLFAVKHKNPINEPLFAAPLEAYDVLNPYARIIVDEAHRRGVHVEVTDAEAGFFRMSYGGRSVHCRESLSELTSAVAMSICDDKAVTHRMMAAAGLTVPEQMDAIAGPKEIRSFLDRHGSVVVKPARGEQGSGVAVGLSSYTEVEQAIGVARAICDRVLIEAFFEGEDLRLVVIDHRLVAAALRRPPRVFGDGENNLRTLITRYSKRRAAATGGESSVPLDEEADRVLADAGLTLDSVPEKGLEIIVRRAANLHTGGSIHDVTDIVHPHLVEAACRASRVIDIPVVGIDLMVRSPQEPDYVFIEANERPGLANHEPQPTAERFIDLLFPQSRIRRGGQAFAEADR